MEEIRCYGCGAILQSDDVKKIGYVPKSSLNKDHVLCKRCFRMKNYHELQETPLTKDDFLRILQYIGEKDCLVVYVIDLFDFNGSMVTGLNRHIGGNDILVLANKRDILPKSLKDYPIEMWVRRQLKEYGIYPKGVVITSSIKNYNFDTIFDTIQKLRKGRDVYVVGVTNVGKSTFINALLKNYTQDHDMMITTSEFPGTTLDLIEIPFDEHSSLFDSPGIINEDQFAHIIPVQLLDKILPKSEVRPINYVIDPNQSFYIGGLARVDFLSGKQQSWQFYFSKNLKIHRTKLEKADDLYNRHKTLTPELEEIKTVDQMKKYHHKVNKNQDIVISGLGFIRVNDQCEIDVYVPDKVSVFIRESLI